MSQKIVYETPEGGIAVVHPTGEVPIEDLVDSVVPPGTPYEIVSQSVIPTDRTFRGAWKATNVGIASTATEVYEDLAVAKEIAHEMRRAKRNELFAPHDEVIMKQIPGDDAVAAEAARAVIRTEYAGIQSAIEESTIVVGIKSTLVDRGIISIVGFGSTSGVGSTSVGVGSTTP
eukprot:GHVR01187652.1.p1 GENE.GHVR01187652.1~~GHVR01187652.1.p1  ORF type:complete len:174 (-),score=31.96 GHVR01187652.1:142-663(-)